MTHEQSQASTEARTKAETKKSSIHPTSTSQQPTSSLRASERELSRRPR